MEFLVGIASSIVGEITKYTIAPIGRQLGYLFHYQNNKEKLHVKTEDFEVFDTRMLTLREIMKALKDPNCSKIGVYGIGGVGKTTLVQEAARQAQEEEKIFSAVVMVTVSQPVDLKNIQQEIAEQLGLPLKEKTEKARADRLKDRLKGETNILIILDDVWKKLELKDVGIYFDKDNQKGCKILLVSRDKHVLCNDMGVEKDIEVGVLLEEEAMKLFNKVVDKRSDECDFKDLATAIVGRYCGGLPIAIVTIASALRGRDIFVWQNALNELKESPKNGYKEIIKRSYDFLESKQEKEILLLCSLFKEDTNVSVEDLMNIYGAYSNMFSLVSLEEARVSVLTAVDNLKMCCLLLKGDQDGTVKLHDVVRRIMISIAEEEGMWCFEKSEQHSNIGGLKGSTAISLIDHDINQLRESLACPRLRLLMHEESCRSSDSPAVLFPKEFLEEAKELRALCLRSVIVKPLPLLPSSLQNLQTLSLQNCVFEDIAFIGELNNLVVLDLSNSEFEKLPKQIGKLTCLRQLNMNNCTNLKVIPPNVISRLVQLEELYMDGVCVDWRTEAVGDMSKNASLVEIKNMSRLRALHLCIGDANVLPRSMFVDGKLKRFNIMVGYAKYHNQATSSRLLQLGLRKPSQLQEYGFQTLMKKCEVLCLGTLPGVNNIICQLDADGFLQLKKLYIRENDEVEHIVESTGEIQPFSAFQNLETLEIRSVQNIEKICCGSFRVKPFGRLRQIMVSQCNKLKNVLPYFVDNWLEKIEIDECNMVKDIVHLESEDHASNCDKIEFPHLRSLVLRRLPNLIHFFSSEMETTYCHASSTVTPGVPFFNAKVTLPSLEILKLFDMFFSNLWPNQLPTTPTLQSLTWLDVFACHKLKYVFPFVIVGGLMQLERLEVTHCSAMEEIIIGAEEERMSSRKINLFPKLKYLELRYLESLQSFCDGDCNIELESLLELQIMECPLLKSFASKARVDQEIGQRLINEKVAFPSLENLELWDTAFLNLWPNQLPEPSTLQNLTRLNVTDCHKLKYVFPLVIVGGLRQLEKLEVTNCSAMEVIITGVEEEGMSSKKILFPKLKCLELKNLESLQSFCDGDCNVELESLMILSIKTCRLLKSFTSKTRVDEEIGQPLINEKVAFPTLEFLKLDEMDFTKLWPNQLPATSALQNITRLNVTDCHKLKYVFSLVIVGGLRQLEKLEVTNCSAMEVIITGVEEEGMSSKKILFPKLKWLELKNLESLQSFCDGDCNVELESLLILSIKTCPLLKSFTSKTRVDEEIGQPLINEKVVFKNLQELYVENCKSLLCLLDLATFESLQQLRKLEVLRCDCMGKVLVVTKEAGDQERNMKKISFPKLELVDLRHLPKLKRFYQGDCIIEFPSLLYSHVIEVEDTEMTEVLFNEKVAFPSLKFLKLDEMDLSKLWPNQLPATSTLQNLTRLNVSYCHKLKYVFSLVIVGGLMQLEKLEVTYCSAMEEIITGGEEDGMSSRKINMFPKLKYLKLKNLESLESFCDGHCTVELESLLELHIWRCPLLKSFTSKTRVDEEIGQPLINVKVAFPSLKFLKLHEMDFSKLWPNQLPATTTLQNLTRLNVTDCHKLKYVFPLVIVGGLRQLQKLQVINCSAMEEIITGVEEEEMSRKKSLFPKLKYLKLENLGSLQSFCDGDCNVELESLLELHIWRCPLRKSFTSKTRVDEEIGQPLINEKVMFKNLQELYVGNCKSLLCLWNLATFEGLQQLKTLEVLGCDLMEEVLVVTKEAGDQERNMKDSFPKLERVELRHLPKLKRFCKGDCTIEFPSLLELEIFDCPELKTFIAKSTTSTTIIEKNVEEREVAEEILFSKKVVFKTLQNLTVERCKSLPSLWELATSENIQHLKKLEISGCELMEEILVVTKEAGDQERKLKISFPKLESLKLKHLPKLKRFCQGDSTIEFLFALELEIQNCNVLRTFIANSTCSTSAIEKVVEEREMAEEVLFNGKVAFCNLERLSVAHCENLKYLLHFAIAGKLVQLKELEVTYCSMMEEIVVVVDDEGGERMSSRKILFPKLRSLKLEYLKSLKAICAGDYIVGCESTLANITYCPLLMTLNEKVALPILSGNPKRR